MSNVPPVRYARTVDGASLAYQSFGSGDVDVVVIPPFAQNIELAWELPENRRMLERMGSFARIVQFDKRGTGASDRTVPVPGLDQRVDDARAVMDAAGVGRGILYGLSEGGPMALLFAVTYPERVSSLILNATAPFIVDQRADKRERWREGASQLAATFGTDECRYLQLMAPTAFADPSIRAWMPRYERQCATPAALRELLDLIEEIDVTDVLGEIRVPTLVLHRRHDPVIPFSRARAMADAIAGAEFVALEGVDHYPPVGDQGWLDVMERFVTGRPPTPRAEYERVAAAAIVTFGGFEVVRAGVAAPLSEWGSRRARTLCKRLAAAVGEPVPRDELIELLWPDDDERSRLSARLSVLLSTVRRLLGGGVIADRDSIRLDVDAVTLDLAEFRRAISDGRLQDAVDLYPGSFLPEDIYAEWARRPREQTRNSYLRAVRQLADVAAGRADSDGVIGHMHRLLAVDPFDSDAHITLIRTLDRAGRFGEAHRAHDEYATKMAELTVPARPFAEIADLPG
jgi:pimeloyl-ACP methyl ester carboxylesterase/DNA-binding SARP family transcriptional activator